MRRSFFQSFYYAFHGLIYCFKTQRNIRVHVVAAVCAYGIGSYLGLGSVEMAALFFAIGLVFVAEILNTAIEKVVDMVSPHYHPLAKIAKDAAAGAVLAAAITALAVGYYLFFSRLY